MKEPIKFLIVDDVPENLVALEALLRRDGLEVHRAHSGAAALELCLLHDFALALLDVQMPDMDGFELAELMRGAEQTKHVPIIFVTAGLRDPHRVFKGYDAGAVDFLFKPVDPHILKSKADVFFELYRQRRELAEALRLSEMFVGILGHDLRNPLAAMMTGTQVLDHTATDDQKRTLRRMTSAGHRMSDMIEQLLDLSRARLAGGLGFARAVKRLDLGALVRGTVDELLAAHPDRAVTMSVSGDLRTAGDSGRLLQLFSNLVSNALVHGTAGHPVQVTVTGEDRELWVTVANRGVIPADRVPTLFDPFRGRGGVSSRSRGLGLGLYISQQIALAHGGAVTVTSTEAEGTCFTVRLPRRSEATKAPAAAAAPTVLVVDDDADIRDSLRDAFEAAGYAVASAATGQEALDQLRPEGPLPDVVVLDLVLPVVDGPRVYRTMQSDPALAHIPVIVATGTPALAPEGTTVLRKPVHVDRLLATVAEQLGRPRGASVSH